MKKLALLIMFLALAAVQPGRAADESSSTTPSRSLAKDSRVFEMRVYYAAPGKFEDLHARFRDHTNKIFVKHGMQIVGYWVPLDKDKGAENKLIYILAYPSREAAKKAWDAFRDDPEWKQVAKASEANGKLVDKVESTYMTATDYSPLK